MEPCDETLLSATEEHAVYLKPGQTQLAPNSSGILDLLFFFNTIYIFNALKSHHYFKEDQVVRRSTDFSRGQTRICILDVVFTSCMNLGR